jgi:hypothetical protein
MPFNNRTSMDLKIGIMSELSFLFVCMHITLDYQTTFIYKLDNFLMSCKIFHEHNSLIVKYYILPKFCSNDG